MRIPDKIKYEINELIKKGEKPEDIYEKLKKEGYRFSLPTLIYICSCEEFKKYSNKKGINFNSFRKFFKDRDFRKIYYSEESDGDNPFILRQKMEEDEPLKEVIKEKLMKNLGGRDIKEIIYFFGYWSEGHRLLKKLGKL